MMTSFEPWFPGDDFQGKRVLVTGSSRGIGAAIAGVLLTANVDSAKYNLGSTFTLSIITAVVLGGTLSTGGKGSIIGTALAAVIISILRYGLPLCFGISNQNLDLPIGIMLVSVVAIRAYFSRGKRPMFRKREKECLTLK